MLGVILPNPDDFEPFHNHRLIMNLPQNIKDQAAAGKIGLSFESTPKKAKVGLWANKLHATVFGTHAVLSASNFSKSKEQSMSNITPLYWMGSETPFEGKTAFFFSKSECSSTKRMKGCTHAWSPWLNSTIWATNYYPIVRSVQIYPQWIFLVLKFKKMGLASKRFGSNDVIKLEKLWPK